MKNVLMVKDRGNVLQISYEDMIKYHGRFHIGGVAMAFKALELAFERLFRSERHQTGTISLSFPVWGKMVPGLSME